MRTLPESFGSLNVRDLGLQKNQLRTLPESFGSLTVGRVLDLRYNQLTTLPESFPTLKVKPDTDGAKLSYVISILVHC